MPPSCHATNTWRQKEPKKRKIERERERTMIQKETKIRMKQAKKYIKIERITERKGITIKWNI